MSIVASTARSQRTSRLESPWTAQLGTSFSPFPKGGARDWSRLEQCNTLVIPANVDSSHWVVIVVYLREERFELVPSHKRIPYSVQHLAYPTLCPPRYRVYDSLDANCNCKRFLNPIRHVCSFAVVGSFMRTATPNVIPNTTRLLTKHTRASSQGIHSALGQQRLTRGRFSPGEVALHRSLRH